MQHTGHAERFRGRWVLGMTSLGRLPEQDGLARTVAWDIPDSRRDDMHARARAGLHAIATIARKRQASVPSPPAPSPRNRCVRGLRQGAYRNTNVRAVRKFTPIPAIEPAATAITGCVAASGRNVTSAA